eukprot:gnl/MRDRNA2_/MRDRNA2_205031_c0_seq1.p1 gnl/MRDRNA2_/MRDRNA2_205031_c0~~gnl/MRDRNA2_/MRDRNA2_205031_c0_seq1.p1  ORF type:complete len:384 (+),score=48.91 gnl/MRDRNA2_/MRDRNA2_205031_c0_seq1:41-1153(+)
MFAPRRVTMHTSIVVVIVLPFAAGLPRPVGYEEWEQGIEEDHMWDGQKIPDCKHRKWNYTIPDPRKARPPRPPGIPRINDNLKGWFDGPAPGASYEEAGAEAQADGWEAAAPSALFTRDVRVTWRLVWSPAYVKTSYWKNCKLQAHILNATALGLTPYDVETGTGSPEAKESWDIVKYCGAGISKMLNATPSVYSQEGAAAAAAAWSDVAEVTRLQTRRGGWSSEVRQGIAACAYLTAEAVAGKSERVATAWKRAAQAWEEAEETFGPNSQREEYFRMYPPEYPTRCKEDPEKLWPYFSNQPYKEAFPEGPPKMYALTSMAGIFAAALLGVFSGTGVALVICRLRLGILATGKDPLLVNDHCFLPSQAWG